MANATLADQYTIATTATFQQKVQEAMVAAAVAIMAEAPTALTPQRIRFAQKVLLNPSGQAALVACYVATDATVIAQAGTNPTNPANVTDAAIINAVSAGWNDYALGG